MQSYLEASLSFIESKEMRDYLRTKLPECRWAAMACAEIVAFAPAPIERKLPVLEQIAWEPEPELAYDGEPFTAYAARYARSCRAALDERYSSTDAAMFWLEELHYDDSPCFDSNAFFTGFDAAIRYLKGLAEEDPEGSAFEGLSYTITKCLPDHSGRLCEYCTWYLNNTLELWYFNYLLRRKDVPDDWESLLDWNLNLPVPFQPGDIVMADCLPYAKPRRVLILDVGDNLDCCCLQALFIRKDGRLFAGAFKHNTFLCYTENMEHSWVSGLYRASRWTGGLTDREEPFAVLSPLIHARPGLGAEIEEYIWKGESDGRSWLEVKEAFGL